MNLKDVYEYMGADYADVMSRLPREESIAKFLRMFKKSEDFENMVKGIETKDYRAVFSSSHNLKGMCGNLSLSTLAKSSSEICEATRHGDPEIDLEPLLAQAKADYQLIIEGIDMLD